MADETMTESEREEERTARAREFLTMITLGSGLRLAIVEEPGCLYVYCRHEDSPLEFETAGEGALWGVQLLHDEVELSDVTIRFGGEASNFRVWGGRYWSRKEACFKASKRLIRRRNREYREKTAAADKSAE